MFPVVLCGDTNVEVGLHVSLYSLLNCNKDFVQIYLILKQYTIASINKIHQTLAPFKSRYNLTIIDYDESLLFKSFKGLHGSQFNFTKLAIAHLIPQCDKIIYLDTDTIVQTDLSNLFSVDLGHYIIGAVASETIATSLKSKFYQSIGMEPTAPYFNSGVMVMDLKMWRDKDCTSLCLDFAHRYVDRVDFGDELILNCVFYRSFVMLDSIYNLQVYPSDGLLEVDRSLGILHFVGSPKPWDLGGEILHSNYKIFEEVLDSTAFKGYESWRNMSVMKVKRTLKLLRSYFICIYKKMQNALPAKPTLSNIWRSWRIQRE